MSLTFRPIIDGFEAYDGDRKVAVIRTRGHDGMSYTSTIKKRHFAEDELPQNKQLRGEKEEVHLPKYTELSQDDWEVRFVGGQGSGKQLQEIMAHKPNCEEAIEDRE
jgi:hypothetical protein